MCDNIKDMAGVRAWVVAEVKRRRENPKSVLDVMPDGASVSWAEVCAKFPDIISQYPTDVDARLDFFNKK